MNDWNEALINSLKRIASLSNSYKIMHMKSSVLYRNYGKYANNIGLFGAGISALLRGAQDYSDFDFMPEWTPEIGAIIAGTALLAIRMGRYDESVHLHKTIAGELSSLIENIQRQFTLTQEARMPGLGYYEWVAKSFDKIVQSSPPIPSSVINSFQLFADKHNLPIPDEFLLDHDPLSSVHIEMGNVIFQSQEDTTPVVNPRNLPVTVPENQTLPETGMETPPQTNRPLGTARAEPKLMTYHTVETDHKVPSSEDSDGSVGSDDSTRTTNSVDSITGIRRKKIDNARDGWNSFVKALARYDDTEMKNDIEQFQRICGIQQTNITRSNSSRTI